MVSSVGLAIELSGQWREVGIEAENSVPTTRIHAANLRRASSETQRLKADARQTGADVRVFVDVEAHVSDVAASARRDVLSASIDLSRDSIRYIGTPAGLMGLIRDIGLAGVADGVTLIPLLPQTPGSEALIALVNEDLTG
jgi:hypothetical protein